MRTFSLVDRHEFPTLSLSASSEKRRKDGSISPTSRTTSVSPEATWEPSSSLNAPPVTTFKKKKTLKHVGEKSQTHKHKHADTIRNHDHLHQTTAERDERANHRSHDDHTRVTKQPKSSLAAPPTSCSAKNLKVSIRGIPIRSPSRKNIPRQVFPLCPWSRRSGRGRTDLRRSWQR